MRKIVESKEKIFKFLSITIMMTMIIGSVSGIFVFANGPGGWGQNAFDVVKELALWGALGVIVLFAVKFIVKRHWAGFFGFLFLGAIVLAIIEDPTRLTSVGTTIWNAIF